ncbi:MAG: creatininase family protein [Candidatus Bathyarchaeota archaeon]|nr:creatininase family protein [Candidatus Bathyarchaeota archaeon]
MLFEHLSGQETRETAEKGSVAVLPIGSIEIHGPHMPTGTDSLIVYSVAKLAAEKADAVVLPPLHYAYVPENRHFPGTISLTAKTLLTLLGEVCDEIARNGLGKILILNGHGGNNDILRVFLRDSLTKEKKYALYAMIDPWAALGDLIGELTQGRTVGHACEVETSLGLFLFEDLVKMERIEREAKLGSTKLPQGIETPVDWQAYATELYLGDPRHATREKGEKLVKAMVEYLADAIRTIKQEGNVPMILDDFYKRAYEY